MYAKAAEAIKATVTTTAITTYFLFIGTTFPLRLVYPTLLISIAVRAMFKMNPTVRDAAD
jgi:hypothetical protein